MGTHTGSTVRPNCGEPVFEREENWYTEDEQERCSCGHLLQIEIDGEDAWVRDRTEEECDAAE